MQSSIKSWLQKRTPTPVIKPSVSDSEIRSSSLLTTRPSMLCTEKSEEDTPDTPLVYRIKCKLRLPQNASLRPVVKETLPEFKRLVQLLLPLPYTDKFFKEIITDEIVSTVTLAAFWHDNNNDDDSLEAKTRLVGGIRCRLLPQSPLSAQCTSIVQVEPGLCLYIATLGVLAPYRRLGIASEMLYKVISDTVEAHCIRSIAAHVWEINEDARAWYTKLGFREVLYEPAYYHRLKPSGAYLLERNVMPSDKIDPHGHVFDS